MAQAISIFNFLKEFNELSNPVITELGNQKWSMNIADLPKIKEIKSVFSSGDVDSLSILEVTKPIIEPCPSPDEVLHEWLENDWRKLSVEKVAYKEVLIREIPEKGGSVNYSEERFDSESKRVDLYNDWILRRQQWQETEKPKNQGLSLYNDLFKLYSDMKKELESVELILGDGILDWQTETRSISHPVLLQKVFLEFDPDIPTFTIKCEEIKTEIYTPLLRIVPSINQTMLADIIQDVDDNIYSIADFENTYPLYRRMVNVIDTKGSFSEKKIKRTTESVIYSSPVLYLRKRTLGYSTFIEGIINEINQKGEGLLPDFFETMIGNYKVTDQNEVIEESWNQSGIDQDILLTLPANNEQLKIIKYLDQYGAVLVQGPPGTGKTHTIANLIGHLLSQGSSVLVTSHTEKALKVLKDKVYKDPINKDLNLQSLCISLLSSKSQKEEMDAAINEIAAKGTSLDLFDSKNKIIRLEDERKKLIEESKKKSNELLYYRSLEYKDIVYGNETIKPIEAAKFIKSGIGNLDYIGGSTSDDTIGLPISSDDLIFLYDTNDSISTSDEEVLKHRVPDFSKVWTPQTFKDNINFLKEKESQILRYTPALKFKDNVIKSAIEGLNSKCKNMLSELENFTPLQQMLISKSIEDRSYPKLWAEILSEFERLIESYEIVRKIMLDEDYDISAALMLENPLSTLDEIIESGKEIPVNFFAALSKPKWKAIKGSITNNGRPIEYRKDWLVVHKLIQYELDKAKLVKKINRLLSESSSDLIVDTYGFEVKGKNYQNIIISSLSWYENKWIDLINEIAIKVIDEFEFQRFSIVDFNNPISSIEAKLNEGLIPALEYQITQIEYAGIQAEWAEFLDYLDEFIGSSGFVNELILAANQKQMDKYQASYLTLSNVLSKKESFMKRKRLLNELGDVAREWARAIEYRQGIHGKKEVPDSIQHAWKWLQLSNQIRRIDEFDPNKAQKYLLDLNMRLTKNAQILAYEKAWFEKIKNRTPAQAQAIEGWRTTIRQIGKATGKKAPALMKKARELMPLCQSAIPVWIMPLNRVVENFDPRNNKFDVVIIDEASQSNILALAALYLGKKIIIVGDDEQVSPDSVGMKKDEVDALIEQYLTGIPNSHLFNGQTSLYDIAKSSGFRPLMLTEHFRCLPEIIGFSNALSYNGRIKPLRDSSRVKIKPAVIEYRVPEGLKSGNKTNVVEAEHIASLVCACADIQEYQGKSIGVISLLGLEQSYEIDKQLQSHMDPVEYEARKIQCGTPPQFQGDERDIIFLSVVEGPSEKGGPVRLLSESGNNDLTRKRYNVAASRAKDQMWVVNSLNPEIDLKPDDIRLRLINYAKNPSVYSDDLVLSVAESPFEAEVMSALINQGYKVIPQMKVGAYRIDMVIEDGNNRIALECDGERWHTHDDLPNDLKRQAILERLGWRFIRVRGSAYYRAPERTLDEIVAELQNHGINPNYSHELNGSRSFVPESNELLEKIKRKAAEIRRSWHEIELKDTVIKEEDSKKLSNDEIDYQPKNETLIVEENKNRIPAVENKSKSRKENGGKAKVKEKLVETHQLNINDVLLNIGNNQKPIFDFRNSQVKNKRDDSGHNNFEDKVNIEDGRIEQEVNNDILQNKDQPRFDFRQKKN